MAISAAEQYALELVNRARLDPAAEAKRFSFVLNQGLDPGTITTAARQPLAPTTATDRAAESQANWIASTGKFAHRRGDALDSAGDRLLNAGFRTEGAVWRWGENLTADNRGSLSETALIEKLHKNWLDSPGHRDEIFTTTFREMSQSWITGRYTIQGGAYDSVGVQVYAASEKRAYVTGVAYTDSNKNSFYSIGEGRSGLAMAIEGGTSASTAAAGGYALSSLRLGEVTVQINKGTIATRLKTDLSDGNVKIDVVNGSYLAVSGDVTLLSGPLRNVVALGVGQIDITGSAAANRLTGNSARNELRGGEGNDTLLGKGGHDRLEGNQANDLLYGGDGNDTLLGGLGFDTLYGGNGNDRLLGGSNHDRLIGDAGNDTLLGEAGWDTLFGSAGNDRLEGGAGNDQLFGGDGRDTLLGGSGNDTLTGGAGADRFVFAGDVGRDRITDFSVAEGDVLAISRALLSKNALSTTLEVTGAGVVLTLGYDQITLAGLKTLAGLAGQVELF